MIKVVYFDELSATDYLNIYNGGEEVQQKEKIKENTKALAEKANINLFAKMNWIFAGGSVSGNIDADFAQKNDSIFKTTLSNTVLTDYLEKAKLDERIEKIENVFVRPPKNSIAFFKMFTPFLVMTKAEIEIEEGFCLDVSKLDDAFKNGKKYYEMIAENSKKQCVLRFNIGAFRNNYGIADISKMDLKYFAVKVGTTEEYLLDIGKEFSMEEKVISSAFEIIDGNDVGNHLDVFDVVLAGVEA
ncbi:MAG: hypothetical protein GX663_01005 [Clostridiales bacterium]|nr:hypothetical protein [Clostridiales bacterium]